MPRVPKPKPVKITEPIHFDSDTDTDTESESDIEEEGGSLFASVPAYFFLTKRARTIYIEHYNQWKLIPIRRIEVCRVPLSFFIVELLDVITFGKFSKVAEKAPYDRLFHLSLRINGKYIFEKTQQIELYERKSYEKNSQILEIELTPAFLKQKTSIGRFLRKTLRSMGTKSYYSYNARSNNCQDLVIASLKANGLLTDNVQTFVKQDSEAIFKELPSWTTRFAKALTDLARIATGGGFRDWTSRVSWGIHRLPASSYTPIV